MCWSRARRCARAGSQKILLITIQRMMNRTIWNTKTVGLKPRLCRIEAIECPHDKAGPPGRAQETYLSSVNLTGSRRAGRGCARAGVDGVEHLIRRRHAPVHQEEDQQR